MLERLLIRHFPNGMLILCDRELRWVVCDGEELGRRGLTSSAMEGRSIYELYPAEVIEDIEPQLRRALAGERITYETTVAGRRYFVQGEPVRIDGEVQYVAISTQEIGELGEKLGRTEQQLGTLVEHLPNTLVAVVDTDLRFVMYHDPSGDPARASSLVGTSISERFRDRPDLLQLFVRALAGEPQSLDVRNVEGTRDYWTQIVPLVRDGRVFGVMSVAQDVTEQRALARELEEARRHEALGVLAGGVAHDFNNLMQAIEGYAALALDDLPDGSPALRKLERIRTAARDATELAQRMLQYSGRRGLELTPVDLSELARRCANAHEVARFELAEGLPPVLADAAQLAHVPAHLIENGVEANGSVTVATGLDDGRVYLEVADDGDGMDEQTVSQMFEPYFTTKFTGRGLGLAAVDGIVRGHGGEIVVESVPGEGTKVRVLLPAAA